MGEEFDYKEFHDILVTSDTHADICNFLRI